MRLSTIKIKGRLAVLGFPALLPLVFMAPAIATFNFKVIHATGNDVLGSGGELLFFIMLAVTPVSLLTRQRWFNPQLRQWYGIMFALTILIGTLLDAADRYSSPDVLFRLAGNLFLLLGLAMALLAVPLLAMTGRRSQRQLGKYWRPLQRFGTYAIWSLILFHLSFLGSRFYPALAVSLVLVWLRLPFVVRWVKDRQRHGKQGQLWFFASPLLLPAFAGYVIITGELVRWGVAAASM